MSSVTVGPRVEFDPDHYPRLRVYDARAGHDRYVYLHRLAAYAHGEISSLWDSRHVHHKNGDGWNNRPGNSKGSTPRNTPSMSPGSETSNSRVPA